MKLFTHLLICLLFLISSTSLAQEYMRANHWYFGYNAGLDFSAGGPVAVSGQLYSTESSSAISDPAGQLLFYTDGLKVWDRNHSVMSNGVGLMGCYSSAQGALIVPWPQSDSLYYVFTLDCYENNLAGGLRYSIVDMSLNNGLGDVTVKNVLLADTMTERLTGVKHANGEDIWIIGHEQGTSRFLSYLITSTGIDTNAVITEIGAVPSVYACIKASPNGDWLGLVNYAMGYDSLHPCSELFSYDDNTGIVTGRVFADTSYWMYNGYGASFSPDNSKFYVAGGPIFQYDLTASTPAAIKASRQLIGAGFSLQLAPDGKIYVARSDMISDTLLAINNPNEAGNQCNYGFALSTLPGTNVIALPAFIESYFNGIAVNTPEINSHHHAVPYPNPARDILLVPGELIGDVSIVALYNLNGQQQLALTVERGEDVAVDVSGLLPGLYYMKINNKHNTTAVKVVVLN